MPISRLNIGQYLAEQFSALAAAVGQIDHPEGYKPDIDNALRRMGKSEAELAAATVDDSLRDAYFALAEFYAARRLWRQLGDRADHTMAETTYKFDGQRDQAKEMMDSAAKLCASLGYNVDGKAAKKPVFEVY